MGTSVAKRNISAPGACRRSRTRKALSTAVACDELSRDAHEGRLNPDIVRVFIEMDRRAILTSGHLTAQA
jgi:hypothetical protein